MKKFVLIAAALTLSLASFAQENGTDRGQRGGRPERPDEATMIKMRTERMVEELGLDEAQGTKLLELNQKYPHAMMGPGGPGGPGMGRPQRDGQRPEAKGDTPKNQKDKKVKKDKKDKNEKPQMTENQMEQMKADREAYEAGLKEILTEEQFKTWQEKGNRPPRGGRPGERPDVS